MKRELVVQEIDGAKARDLWAIVKRRWLLILLTILGVLALAALYTQSVTPTYQSQTVIQLEGNNPSANSLEGLNPLNNYTIPNTNGDISAQIDVIQGTNTERDTMIALGLTPPAPSPDLVRDPNVQAIQSGTTNIVQVNVISTNEKLVQNMAQQLPITYNDNLKAAINQELTDTKTAEETKLAAAQNNLQQAQANLSKFSVAHNITNIDIDSQSKLRDLEDATGTKRRADQLLASSTSTYAGLQASLEQMPQTISDPNNDSNATYVQEQAAKLTDLEGQLATAQVLYNENSPKVQQLEAAVAKQKNYINNLPKAINNNRQIRNPNLDNMIARVAQAKADEDGARSGAADAASKVATIQAEIDALSKLKGPYDQLQQAVTSNAQVVAQISADSVKLAQFQTQSRNYVSIVGAATPARKIKPVWSINLAVAFLFGIVIAWGIVSIWERWDDRIYASEMGRGIAGLKPIGAVPLPASSKSALVVATDTPMANSFRVLRSNLLFTVSGEAMRSIAVVSARNNEGRSEIAANLAASLSMGSHQVVLIDANLRRPGLHRLLNVVEGPGLTDVLLGYKKSREVVQETSIEGLSVISAGSQSQSTTELLSSEAFGMLLDELKERYHFIIVDTASCMVSSDAQVTADVCDATVVVMKIGVSKRSNTRYCMDLLRRTRTNILGAIYNRPGFNPNNAAINIEDMDSEEVA